MCLCMGAERGEGFFFFLMHIPRFYSEGSDCVDSQTDQESEFLISILGVIITKVLRSLCEKHFRIEM